MFRRIFALRNLMPLALLGSLLASRPAAAQQGWHLYEWSGGRGGYSNGRVTGYPSFVLPQAGTNYGNVSTSSAGEDSAVNRAVAIAVSVPADAEIWFDDAKTTQSGALRQFVSPPLTAGPAYFYELKARWTEDGKEVTRGRRVTVHAGDVIHVSFNSVAVVSRIP
jgi:uncharacterized protein (TIGR03000 family)